LWHPVWKFWGIEKRLWRRIFAEVLLAILVFGLGYFVWPVKQEQIPPPTTNERPYFVIYGSPTIKTNLDCTPAVRQIGLEQLARVYGL
jgi:hypothetical protein